MENIERIPAPVRRARTMWAVAIGAGIFETVLVVASGQAGAGAAAGVAVRVAVFAAAALAVAQMAAGRQWARVALAVGLGVFGLLSLVADPLLWLAEGGSPLAVIRESGPVDLLFGASRAVHVTAVLAACALMFQPAANRYFRTRRAARRRETVGTYAR
ncbi:hypothetical protein Dvina_21810 [Dactylosporangium vinaceum]|uniref:Integral membrane protein n=1 Tax=Dactylosporangium vinaceum TaxID=53362 RepID=A0ABV5MRG2_9ACTN|nr:hypothetical protein [Dactylosporangium vinaceum]UAC00450.1 hypothetical protein Dvina_21810 [Dactylosporangium vinaceum]